MLDPITKVIDRIEIPERSVEELTELVVAGGPITSLEAFWFKQQLNLMLVGYNKDEQKSRKAMLKELKATKPEDFEVVTFDGRVRTDLSPECRAYSYRATIEAIESNNQRFTTALKLQRAFKKCQIID